MFAPRSSPRAALALKSDDLVLQARTPVVLLLCLELLLF